ncbi:class I SAM-dependent methyltransferase [Desulfoscipio sp. XC116]|uniref:class I SAM-dependent methyltransferase n=1 Tax=Desulfoscipio sp. XC116 TaxID=3144975 RepID=UPI00325BC438
MELNTRIKSYWEGEAEGYSDAIKDELKGFERKTWTKLILEYAPSKDCLDILDIGTGPGFFPIILSQVGHKVTGIDLTENMIECARQNLEKEGIAAKLWTMDCQALEFPDNCFDLLLCRNLTWTLDDPQKAYKEWFRVLRSGGRLLVFDACWYLHLFHEDLKKAYEKKQQEILLKYGRPLHQHKDQAEGDALSRKLFMSDKVRPQWDLNIMLCLGFSKVFADVFVGRRILTEQQQDINNIHPPFLVGGEK